MKVYYLRNAKAEMKGSGFFSWGLGPATPRNTYLLRLTTALRRVMKAASANVVSAALAASSSSRWSQGTSFKANLGENLGLSPTCLRSLGLRVYALETRTSQMRSHAWSWDLLKPLPSDCDSVVTVPMTFVDGIPPMSFRETEAEEKLMRASWKGPRHVCT